MKSKYVLAIVFGIILIGAIFITIVYFTQDSKTDQNIISETCEGYTLLSGDGAVFNDLPAYLIDMEGNVVQEWSISGAPVKMLPGGSIIGSKRGLKTIDRRAGHDTIELIQLSWDGLEEWSFTNWDSGSANIMMSRQHHDFQREGNPVGYYSPCYEFDDNGNTLILAHKDVTDTGIIKDSIIDDVIYEVDWQGNILFEWYAYEHFDEFGFDEEAKKSIYKKNSKDWLHVNSMSYLGENQWYDQGNEIFNPENIIISSREASIIAIISKETGEIVWKVGPVYAEGPESSLSQIIGQHHPHIIPKGLPGAGNILVFDNGWNSGYGGSTGYPRFNRPYSRVIEFNPITFEIIWQYGGENLGNEFYSSRISSAQRLPNGNTMIDEGTEGRIFEVNYEKEIVWEYEIPKRNNKDVNVYRAYRIPPEWLPLNPEEYDAWSELYTNYVC